MKPHNHEKCLQTGPYKICQTSTATHCWGETPWGHLNSLIFRMSVRTKFCICKGCGFGDFFSRTASMSRPCGNMMMPFKALTLLYAPRHSMRKSATLSLQIRASYSDNHLLCFLEHIAVDPNQFSSSWMLNFSRTQGRVV